MNYWIIKSEPETYSWQQLVAEGRTAWTGVRNFTARNNIRAMKKGDLVFFYHSGDDKSIIGLARVEKEFYPDPTAEEGDWQCMDVSPVKAMTKVVTLAQVKADKVLRETKLATQGRLSVSPLTKAQFDRLLELAETKA